MSWKGRKKADGGPTAQISITITPRLAIKAKRVGFLNSDQLIELLKALLSEIYSSYNSLTRTRGIELSEGLYEFTLSSLADPRDVAKALKGPLPVRQPGHWDFVISVDAKGKLHWSPHVVPFRAICSLALVVAEMAWKANEAIGQQDELEKVAVIGLALVDQRREDIEDSEPVKSPVPASSPVVAPSTAPVKTAIPPPPKPGVVRVSPPILKRPEPDTPVVFTVTLKVIPGVPLQLSHFGLATADDLAFLLALLLQEMHRHLLGGHLAYAEQFLSLYAIHGSRSKKAAYASLMGRIPGIHAGQHLFQFVRNGEGFLVLKGASHAYYARCILAMILAYLGWKLAEETDRTELMVKATSECGVVKERLDQFIRARNLWS